MPDRRRGPASTAALVAALVGAALACAVAVWRLYRASVVTALGQQRDERLSDRAVSAASGLPTEVLGLVSVASLTAVLLLACAIALVRRRPELALAAGLVVLGANLTTQVLKLALERPDLGLSTVNSFPSGHTTAAASAAAALVLVVPWTLVPVVLVLGGAFSAWVGLATVLESWHRVSDAVAAGVVVAGWTAVALVVVALLRPVRAAPVGLRTREMSPS